MKRIFVFFTFCLSVFSYSLSAQVRSLPLGIDTNNITPDQIRQIPSPEKLKSTGATDNEIKLIMEFKQRKLAVSQLQSIDTTKTNPLQLSEIISADSIKTSKLTQTQLPPVKTFGQEFFRNNNLNFFDKGTEIKAPDNYFVGVGDEINVVVWGYSDYNEVFIVDKNGFIQPKETGRIYVRGMRFSDAKDLIRKKFSSFLDLNNSKLEVTLIYSRIITVNIVGEVFNPGSYTIPAINTAFNALIASSGPNQIGSVRNIIVKRNGETVKTLDIYEYLLNPNSKEDFFLENNDYIFVPPSKKIISLRGETKRSDSLDYELLENENLNKLVKYAGGLPPSASTKTIQIKRYVNNEQIYLDVSIDSLNDVELKDGDLVIVKKITQKIENTVIISGAVRIPGMYQIKSNDRLFDVIDRAKGITYDTYTDKAQIIRLNKDFSKSFITINLLNALANKESTDNVVLQQYDSILIFTKSSFQDEYFINVTGAVRNPNKFLFAEGMSLKDAIYLSGGLKKEADNKRIELSRTINYDPITKKVTPTLPVVITYSLIDDWEKDNKAINIKLQPYDQIFVRKDSAFDLQENITILGEVNFPGRYTLKNKNEKLSDILIRAGGLTQWAFPKAATIYRQQDSLGFVVLDLSRVLKNKNSKFNYVLKEGDSINVPRINNLVQIQGAVSYLVSDTIIDENNINNQVNDYVKKINTPYHNSKRAGYYIRTYALGFSKYSYKRKTYVKQANGKVDRTINFVLFKVYPKVEEGSLIDVPFEIKKVKSSKVSDPIDWNKIIEGFTVKLTGILTLYLLITKVK